MLGHIKRIILKFLLSNNKRWIAKDAIIHSSFFEGKNSIGKKSSIIKSYIGLGSYLGNDCNIHGVKIGRFCSIANSLRAGMGVHPTTKFVSTFPAFYYNTEGQIPFSFFTEETPIFPPYHYVKDSSWITIIGNDVWIGERVFIADGITVGDGAIIAAGSVVTKDVEPYSIVGGVPAKEIRKRFSQEQINFLSQDKWWEQDFAWIADNYKKFFDISEYIRWKLKNDKKNMD